jgi:hypothetical protein
VGEIARAGLTGRVAAALILGPPYTGLIRSHGEVHVQRDEWDFYSPSEAPLTETEFAQGRIPGRFYTSKTFANRNPYSADVGQPSRFVYEVFDDDGLASKLVRDGEEWQVTPIERSKSQVKVLVSREAGALVDLWIQRVPLTGTTGLVKDVLRLRRDDAIRLMQFVRHLELVEPAGADTGTRLDDEMVADLLNRPQSAELIYGKHADVLRTLIENDAQARDVVALAGRRAVLEEFRRLLDDDDYFDSRVPNGRGPESVWQQFFEDNSWLLGVGLGTQLLTAWSPERMEQVVAGFAIDRAGKRTDALLKTSGIVKSLVFAEIKHHRTKLLRADKYRPGSWSPSSELAGGVAQAQMTVQRAIGDIGQSVTSHDASGFDIPGDITYLIRPRSFLVAGRLSEFVAEGGGHHRDMVTSFELHRRHLQEPEILTFDELLARAEWIVESGT